MPKIRSPFYQNKLKSIIQSKQVQKASKDAVTWFNNRAEALRDKNIKKKYFQTVPNERKKSRALYGRMYYYSYDAKYKDKLPFWDMRPLIFPFKTKGKHFWGINLHLAPPAMRAVLMDSLYEIANNDKFDESTKLRLNWNVLSSFSNYKYFKPCVRKYLKSHVESNFIEVPSSEWEIAMFLPLQKIVGGNQTAYKAYRDAL